MGGDAYEKGTMEQIGASWGSPKSSNGDIF